MKEKILNILDLLRTYALSKGYIISIFYHEEDSSLMRFANSAISLNTREHLIRMEFTAYDGKKRASYGMITNLSAVDDMKRGIDQAAEMVQHAMPLTYEPTCRFTTQPSAMTLPLMPAWLKSAVRKNWRFSTKW